MTATPTVTAVATELTGAQQGIVNAQLVDEDPALFTVGELVHLTVAPDAPALDPAVVAAVVAQAVAESGVHALRVDPDGTAVEVQDTVPDPQVLPLPDVAAARAWAAARIAAGIPLGADPLHHQHVLVLGPRHVAWSTAAHHVLLDGWGLALLVRRVVELLAAHRTGTAPPAAWTTPRSAVLTAERDHLDSPAAARDRDALLARSGSDDAVRGFGAGERSPGTPVARSGRLAVTGPRLDAAAAALDVTWADLAVAAQLLVLARVGGSTEVVLGVPLMNRTGPATALCATTVVNVLPLAARVEPGTTVRDLVTGAADGLRALRRHGRFRGEELARRSGRVRREEPLVGAELNLKTFDHPESAADVVVEVETLREGPVDDLSVSVQRRRDGRLDWTAQAPAGLLTAGQVDALVDLLDTVLGALTTADPAAAVASLGAPAPAATPAAGAVAGEDDPGAVELLRDSVSRHPDRTALVDGEVRWTYRELAARVAGTAALLRDRTAPGAPVALLLPRGAEAVAALLACFVAGRLAVPFDPQWPAARRDLLLAGLGEDAFVLDAGVPEAASRATLREFDLPSAVTPAYVVHTSGSTGTPKAVLVTHGAFAAFLAHHRATTFAPGRGVPAGRALRVAQTLPLVFDGSWDTLQALLSGHEVHLLPRTVVQDPAETVAAVRTAGLEFVDTTPTVAAALLEAGLLDPGHPVRILTVGGEACPPPLWARLVAEPDLVVRNLYGPTEATVDAVGLEGDEHAPGGTPIGRPVRGMGIRVLDAHLNPVPVGFRGELHLTGPQLALGYRGAAGLTAARFTADPWGPPGSRTYRTGDVVSLRPDGILDYHGRADRQVKVRGHRVEPAEVEAGLLRLPGVRQAAVVVRDGRLLGYVVGPPEGAASGLREAAAGVLPEHLVPAVVVVLRELPRTTTGKVDPAALPDPAHRSDPGGRPPSGPAETALAAALAEALGPGADLHADADFFALGGDSITAIRAVAGFRARGFASSVSRVFTLRTLSAVAAAAEPLAAPAGVPPARTALPPFDADQRSRVHELIARRTRRPGGPRP